MSITDLIQAAQSADKSIRETAESQLLQSCDANASEVLTSLINVALDGNIHLSSRQFALLSLRKFITFYWSPGFESYRNTSQVNEADKNKIREGLLQLCLNDNQDTRIRNGASYCIVQISAVDFPDQWPQLLEVLYKSIAESHSLSALALLNEIYDDIISEEMFYEGGIGSETLRIILGLLSNQESNIQAKIAATNLLKAALLQMSALESTSHKKRKEFVTEVIPNILSVLSGLFSDWYQDINKPERLALKSKVYEALVLIKNDFPKKFIPFEAADLIKAQLDQDMHLLQCFYQQVLLPDHTDSLSLDGFNECGINMIELLIALSNKHQISAQEMEAIIYDCVLHDSIKESWVDDFNVFISKETGLAATYTVRDEAAEFLTSLSDSNLTFAFERILNSISIALQNNDGNLLESGLYLLQCILSNEDDLHMDDPKSIVELVSALFNFSTVDMVLRGRIVLVTPKILDKFMDVIPDIKQLTQNILSESIESALKSGDDLIRSCTLIAFTYFTYFAELPSVLGNELCGRIQENMLNIINTVSENAEEDTNSLLMETLNHVIDCNITDITDQQLLKGEFTLVLSISGKDPSNIQIVVESQECLEKLLEGINTQSYTQYIEMCLPSFVHIIQGNKVLSYKYSPLLTLILEFVTVFMKKKPSDGLLPNSVSEYIFETLVDVLQVSTEDETLQLATDAFSYLIFNTEISVMVPRLETIVRILDRLLSINISDTAAMNVGTLIVTIFSKFSQEIQSLIPNILDGAVSRLIKAQNISTQQNLISLLCFLTCSDPQQTINLLFDLSSTKEQNTIQPIFNKWFEAFEVIRGEKKIKENIIALSKVYFLQDPRVAALTVNGDLVPYDGDLIITRSMAKSMPDKYTQISAYAKIVKLFISELGFQGKQPDPNEYTKLATDETSGLANSEDINDGDNSENDDWEDVDDVLDYDKLREFVDDEDPAEFGDDDNDEITGLGDIQQSITELLIEFFKSVTAKNTNNFQDIYNTLSESEKACLTENIV